MKFKSGFSGWTRTIYWRLVPALLFGVVSFWIYYVWWESGSMLFYQLINTATSAFILNSMFLYLKAMNQNSNKK